MVFRRWKSLIVSGVGAVTALCALSACEEVEQKQKNFEDLTGRVSDQISHDVLGEPTAIDYLERASVVDRAMAGVLSAPVEAADQTLEDALRTESYFVVGSVIAKPKAQMTNTTQTAMVEGEELTEPMISDEEMAAIEEAAPEVVEDIRTPAIGLRPVEGVRLNKEARLKLRSVVEDKNKQFDPDVRRALSKKLSTADAAEKQLADNSGARLQEFSAVAPRLPSGARAPRIRKELDLPKAQQVRLKAIDRLERMGLSGSVMTRDSGQMVIQIGADPTHYNARKVKLDQKFRRFAPNKLPEKPWKKRRDGRLDCEDRMMRSQMKSDVELATRCVVEEMQASGDYEYVEPDYIFTNQFERRSSYVNEPISVGALSPNDPLWTFQWHFKPQGANEGESMGGAGFEAFWERAAQTGSAAVTVAVVDTGLQMDHPDIKASTNLAPGFDMVSDPFMGNDGDGRDSDPNDPGDACDPNDPLSQDSFHGTHVAGTVGVAATNNASGVAGGAWNVTIVPVRALGRCGGQLSDINDAIRWAAGVVPARDDLGAEIWNANPADIINLSIGLFERCPASLQEAINDAVDAGAVVVAAAGNARIDTQYYAPGGCANVVSVAASDARGQLTPYSNYGLEVDILAPGGDLTRDDDGDGRPDGVLSTKFSKGCYDPVTNDAVESCFYAYESGTSMAAPHVSAALALLKSQFPLESADALTDRLLAASAPRNQSQCSGKCSQYPGAAPIPGEEGMCFRPCGGAILDLGVAEVE